MNLDVFCKKPPMEAEARHDVRKSSKQQPVPRQQLDEVSVLSADQEIVLVILLVMLIVWGNTWAMLGMSLLGILTSLLFYPGSVGRRAAAGIGVVCLVALLLAMLL
jgi:hypothetical protein